jgi:hypothetical protein
VRIIPAWALLSRKQKLIATSIALAVDCIAVFTVALLMHQSANAHRQKHKLPPPEVGQSLAAHLSTEKKI